MKMLETHHGRTTVLVPQVSIKVGGLVATNALPFLVRAKYCYEPLLKPLEDDPGAPEWFAFDGLYCWDETLFFTGEGVVVKVSPSADLLMLLDKSQLSIVEAELRKSIKEYGYV